MAAKIRKTKLYSTYDIYKKPVLAIRFSDMSRTQYVDLSEAIAGSEEVQRAFGFVLWMTWLEENGWIDTFTEEEKPSFGRIVLYF